MLVVWIVLIYNLFHPFRFPLNILIHIALFLSVFMHGLQILLLKATLKPGETLSKTLQARVFLFGVFELLAWEKAQNAKKTQTT